MQTTQEQETLLQNDFNKFSKIALKATGERSQAIETLLETLGERIVMCPASLQESQPWSSPGGLIKMSLDVTGKMRTILKGFEELPGVDSESLVIVGLFHGLGMIGSIDTNEEYFVNQDSDWHRRQGRLYRYNEKLPKVPIAHRSLQILQHFGVKLTPEEWVAIAISGGPWREENRFYVGSEPSLAVLLTQARQWVLRQYPGEE